MKFFTCSFSNFKVNFINKLLKPEFYILSSLIYSYNFNSETQDLVSLCRWNGFIMGPHGISTIDSFSEYFDEQRLDIKFSTDPEPNDFHVISWCLSRSFWSFAVSQTYPYWLKSSCPWIPSPFPRTFCVNAMITILNRIIFKLRTGFLNKSAVTYRYHKT